MLDMIPSKFHAGYNILPEIVLSGRGRRVQRVFSSQIPEVNSGEALIDIAARAFEAAMEAKFLSRLEGGVTSDRPNIGLVLGPGERSGLRCTVDA